MTKHTMKTLALGIFKDMVTQSEITQKVIEEFEADPKEVLKYKFLIAYVDYGSYEGTGWMLMREKATGNLFMNHSSHCSCYGNEGQFKPETAPIEYLKSDKFSIYCYENEDALIREYIKRMRK